MIGRDYTLGGLVVRVVARWAPPSEGGSATCPRCGVIYELGPGARGVYCGCQGWAPTPPLIRPRRQGPRNVLLRRPDGSLFVRPFRGLRRVKTP